MLETIRVPIATYRLTKLVMEDEITREIRDKIYDLLENHPKLQYLMYCPWCISIYTGVIALVAEKYFPELNSILIASAITGLIYERI